MLFALGGMAGTAYAESKSASYTMRVTIPPLFELEVTGPSDGVIDFEDFKRDATQTTNVSSEPVTIRARSNLGKAYQISQKLVGPLTSDTGSTLPPEDLTVSATNLDKNGKASGETTVSVDEPTPLFTSNADGKGDTVKTSYNLKVKADSAAGTYQAKIVYSIVTL